MRGADGTGEPWDAGTVGALVGSWAALPQRNNAISSSPSANVRRQKRIEYLFAGIKPLFGAFYPFGMR
jgi:hypothetical protein